jgi:large subunit ribosomal protein L21
MYAVIRTGGKQYRVEPGFEFLVEKLIAEPGQTIEIADVLMYSEDDKVSIGTPLCGVTAHCKVVDQELGPKLTTVKYRRRHNYKKKYGHRQNYTRLVIEKIERKG